MTIFKAEHFKILKGFKSQEELQNYFDKNVNNLDETRQKQTLDEICRAGGYLQRIAPDDVVKPVETKENSNATEDTNTGKKISEPTTRRLSTPAGGDTSIVSQ